MVDDLLLLARAEMHEFTVDLVKSDLHNLLTQNMALWQKQPRDLDLKWLANNEVQVLIDKDRIVQVLTILIENAHKYSYPDTPIVQRVESEGPNINVSVIDSGEGISSSLG